MPDVRSVTIIGGGVIGCFLAYRLALEGVPVTLIERHAVGAGATGASAGNVQPGVGHAADLRVVQRSQRNVADTRPCAHGATMLS
jgi:glycine/D-amino acid oxidase-like deaminating enzyme